MLTLRWVRGSMALEVGDETILDCSCRVRNFENGLRRAWEVVHTMPNGKPYQPQMFPVGHWKVGKPLPRTQPDRAPYFIPTDAFAEVTVWKEENGGYTGPTDEKDIDKSYGLHYSIFNTTLGCIKISAIDDLRWLVKRITEEIAKGEEVWLDVVEEDNDAAQEG